MLPEAVKKIETNVVPENMYDAVQELSVAEIEDISISDISTLENNSLKDLLNHAVVERLSRHLGGTYTSPPKGSLAEAAQTSAS